MNKQTQLVLFALTLFNLIPHALTNTNAQLQTTTSTWREFIYEPESGVTDITSATNTALQCVAARTHFPAGTGISLVNTENVCPGDIDCTPYATDTTTNSYYSAFYVNSINSCAARCNADRTCRCWTYNTNISNATVANCRMSTVCDSPITVVGLVFGRKCSGYLTRTCLYENSLFSASCPSAGYTITILRAIYGTPCTNPALCNGTDSTTIFRNNCDGKQNCSLYVINSVLSNPCTSTTATKTVQVDWTCTRAASIGNCSCFASAPVAQAIVADCSSTPATSDTPCIDHVPTDQPFIEIPNNTTRASFSLNVTNKDTCSFGFVVAKRDYKEILNDYVFIELQMTVAVPSVVGGIPVLIGTRDYYVSFCCSHLRNVAQNLGGTWDGTLSGVVTIRRTLNTQYSTSLQLFVPSNPENIPISSFQRGVAFTVSCGNGYNYSSTTNDHYFGENEYMDEVATLLLEQKNPDPEISALSDVGIDTSPVNNSISIIFPIAIYRSASKVQIPINLNFQKALNSSFCTISFTGIASVVIPPVPLQKKNLTCQYQQFIKTKKALEDLLNSVSTFSNSSLSPIDVTSILTQSDTWVGCEASANDFLIQNYPQEQQLQTVQECSELVNDYDARLKNPCCTPQATGCCGSQLYPTLQYNISVAANLDQIISQKSCVLPKCAQRVISNYASAISNSDCSRFDSQILDLNNLITTQDDWNYCTAVNSNQPDSAMLIQCLLNYLDENTQNFMKLQFLTSQPQLTNSSLIDNIKNAIGYKSCLWNGNCRIGGTFADCTEEYCTDNALSRGFCAQSCNGMYCIARFIPPSCRAHDRGVFVRLPNQFVNNGNFYSYFQKTVLTMCSKRNASNPALAATNNYVHFNGLVRACVSNTAVDEGTCDTGPGCISPELIPFTGGDNTVGNNRCLPYCYFPNATVDSCAAVGGEFAFTLLFSRTSQSSTYNNRLSSIANDKWFYGGIEDTVSHTIQETNPWWRGELATQYFITKIAIYNRVDYTCTEFPSDWCAERLMPLTVRVVVNTTTINWTVVAERNFSGPAPSVLYWENVNVTGNIVEIVAPGASRWLSMAEVTAYTVTRYNGSWVASAQTCTVQPNSTSARNMWDYGEWCRNISGTGYFPGYYWAGAILCSGECYSDTLATAPGDCPKYTNCYLCSDTTNAFGLSQCEATEQCSAPTGCLLLNTVGSGCSGSFWTPKGCINTSGIASECVNSNQQWINLTTKTDCENFAHVCFVQRPGASPLQSPQLLTPALPANSASCKIITAAEVSDDDANTCSNCTSKQWVPFFRWTKGSYSVTNNWNQFTWTDGGSPLLTSNITGSQWQVLKKNAIKSRISQLSKERLVCKYGQSKDLLALIACSCDSNAGDSCINNLKGTQEVLVATFGICEGIYRSESTAQLSFATSNNFTIINTTAAANSADSKCTQITHTIIPYEQLVTVYTGDFGAISIQNSQKYKNLKEFQTNKNDIVVSEIISDGIGLHNDANLKGITICIIILKRNEGRLKFASLDILQEKNSVRKSLGLQLPLNTQQYCLDYEGGNVTHYVIGVVENAENLTYWQTWNSVELVLMFITTGFYGALVIHTVRHLIYHVLLSEELMVLPFIALALVVVVLTDRIVYFIILAFGAFDAFPPLFILFSDLPSLIFLSIYSITVLRWADIYHNTMSKGASTSKVIFAVAIGFNVVLYIIFIICLIIFLSYKAPSAGASCVETVTSTPLSTAISIFYKVIFLVCCFSISFVFAFYGIKLFSFINKTLTTPKKSSALRKLLLVTVVCTLCLIAQAIALIARSSGVGISSSAVLPIVIVIELLPVFILLNLFEFKSKFLKNDFRKKTTTMNSKSNVEPPEAHTTNTATSSRHAYFS